MHDIIPPDRRSIRNIPLKKEILPIRPSVLPERHVSTSESTYEFEDSVVAAERQHSFFFYAAAIIIPVLAAIVGLGLYSLTLSGADVTVTPKTQAITVSIPFDTTAASTTPAGIPFSTIEKETTFAIELPSAGEERVDTVASGRIMVYNNYSTSPQKLIAHTRFQSTDGKIYRIKNALVVPGKSIKGGITIPGSIEVPVYADAAGESYNKDLTDFTIPGFTGDPRFKTIYARSKTKITGGFSGMRHKVSVTELEKKTTSAVAQAQTELSKQLQATSDPLVLGNTATFEHVEIGRTTKDGIVTIVYKLTAKAPGFPRTELSKRIIDQSSIVDDKKSLFINDFSGLTLSKTTSNNLYTITGSTTVIWFYNAEKLAQDLAGIPKETMKDVLTRYTGILNAESMVRPFWKTTFPADVKKIRIIDTTDTHETTCIKC